MTRYGILESRFLGINSNLLRLEFSSAGFLPSFFPFLQTFIHEKSRVFLFRGFFLFEFLKTREEYGLQVGGTVDRREQKTIEPCVNLMSKNSI